MEIILYYRYMPVADVSGFVASQEELCRGLRLAGRVRVSPEGVNGTLGGARRDIDEYIGRMAECSGFEATDWKRSAAGTMSIEEIFPGGLSVKETKELVSSGGTLAGLAADQGGERLSPEAFHKALLAAMREERSANGSRMTMVVDVRNIYEQVVGQFPLATSPETRSFGGFAKWAEAHREALSGADTVLMYCTGGVRCEKASAFVVDLLGREAGDARSARTAVKQLDGGIHRYLERYPNGGLFRGENFVFDGRISVPAPAHGSEPPVDAAISGHEALARADAIVGCCEECGQRVDNGSGRHRDAVPPGAKRKRGAGRSPHMLKDGNRCRACRMLVLVCGACESEYRGDLFCRLCKKDGLGGRTEAAIAAAVDAARSAVQSPANAGRARKVRRAAARKRLALLERRLKDWRDCRAETPAGPGTRDGRGGDDDPDARREPPAVHSSF